MSQHHLSAFHQASLLPTLHMHMFKKGTKQVTRVQDSSTTTWIILKYNYNVVWILKENNNSASAYLPSNSPIDSEGK
jgi:hypothetical protein